MLDGVSFRCNLNRCRFRQMQTTADSDRTADSRHNQPDNIRCSKRQDQTKPDGCR
ncbi:hypothetical protein Tco_1432709, partial [Tanacetum coccineum]